MSEHRRFGDMAHTAGRIVGTEAIIAGSVGLFCLLVGWHTAGDIAQALVIAGVLILAASCADSYTGRNEPHCAEHQYVQMTMRATPGEDRPQPNTQGWGASAQAVMRGVIFGGLTIGIGLAVEGLFG